MAEKRRALPILYALGAGLFILCLPMFLVSTNLRWALNAVPLYKYGFDKYEVSRQTGIGDEELLRAGRELIRYFNSGEESLQITVVTEEGEELELFTEREVAHLKEVKGVIALCYRLQEATFLYLAGFVGAGYLWQRGRFTSTLARLALWGSALTLGLLLILGIAALVNFEGLFLAFHRLFFASGYWVLDPTDYLIRMFPQGFFSDATLFVAGAIIVESLLIGGLGLGFLLARRRSRVSPS